MARCWILARYSYRNPSSSNQYKNRESKMKQLELFPIPGKTHILGPEFWFTNSPPRPTKHALEVLQRYESGETGKQISVSYGLKSSSTISHVVRRTRKLLERMKKIESF